MPHPRRNFFTLLFVVLMVIPAAVWADAGTPLMWASMIHLVVGNAVLGCIEGLILAWVFGLKKAKTLSLMVVANYFSMLVGMGAITGLGSVIVGEYLGEQILFYALAFVWCMLGVSFLLTIILELPFCWIIMGEKENRFQLSFKASLIAQVVSYILLVPMYWLASGTSLLTQLEIVPPIDFYVSGTPTRIYYLTRGGEIHSINPDATHDQIVYSSLSASERGSLFFHRDINRPGWDLCTKPNRWSDEHKIIVPNVLNHSPRPKQMYGSYPDSGELEKNEAVSLRSNGSPGNVFTGGWPIEGIRFGSERGGIGNWFAVDTPFLSWTTLSATVLPDGQVVFQLGPQIVLLDLAQKKIGPIALGSSPVVVLGYEDNNRESSPPSSGAQLHLGEAELERDSNSGL